MTSAVLPPDPVLRQALVDTLTACGVIVDAARLRDNRPLQLQASIPPGAWDSFLAAIQARFHIRIPLRERDQLVTLDDVRACLRTHGRGGAGRSRSKTVASATIGTPRSD